MNWMPLLYYCEIQIRDLNRAKKIQLYLLPVLISILIIYHMTPAVNASGLQVQQTAQKIEIQKDDFFQLLEKKLQMHELQLHSFQEDEQGFVLEIEGSFHALLYLLEFCESYKSVNILNQVTLEAKEDEPTQALLNVQFQFEKKLYKKGVKQKSLHEQIEALKNPFLKEKTPFDQGLKLFAIVNDEVLINEQWLEKNGKIQRYKLVRIANNYVVLKKKNGQIMHLKLAHE